MPAKTSQNIHRRALKRKALKKERLAKQALDKIYTIENLRQLKAELEEAVRQRHAADALQTITSSINLEE